jgi:hypothetical protein
MNNKTDQNHLIKVSALPAIAYIAAIIIATGMGIFFVWGQYEANITLRNCIQAGGHGWIEMSWGNLYKVICKR